MRGPHTAAEEGNTDEIIASQERLNRAQAEYARLKDIGLKIVSKFSKEHSTSNKPTSKKLPEEPPSKSRPKTSKPKPKAKAKPSQSQAPKRKTGRETLVHERRARGDDRPSMALTPRQYKEEWTQTLRSIPITLIIGCSSFPEYDWQDQRDDGRTATATANQRLVGGRSVVSKQWSKIAQSAVNVHSGLSPSGRLSPEQYANQLIKERDDGRRAHPEPKPREKQSLVPMITGYKPILLTQTPVMDGFTAGFVLASSVSQTTQTYQR